MRLSISGELAEEGRQPGESGQDAGGSKRGRSASDVSFLAPTLISGTKTTPTNLPAPTECDDTAADGANNSDAGASTAPAAVEDVNAIVLSPKDEIDASRSAKGEEEEDRVRIRRTKEAPEELAQTEVKFGGKVLFLY